MSNNMVTADRLKSCRIRACKTLEQIGEFVGVHKTTVMRWEKGETERIGLPTIQNLASYYNVNPAWLMGADVPMQKESDSNIDYATVDNIIPMPIMKKVPLLGTIACGEPILAEENIEAYINMPDEVNGTFALRCKGDSMINARIFDGDIVFIRQQPDVENGTIAAVLIDNEATLKKVYKYPNRIELRAENPTMRSLEYEGEEMNNVHIIGKAVYFLSAVQ